MDSNSTLFELCEQLEEIMASGKPLSMIDAVCETGADPKLLRSAFEDLQLRGKATLIGSANRGWSLVRKTRSDARTGARKGSG
jgi:hypothetical protein